MILSGLAVVLGTLWCLCDGVHVSVQDQRRMALLFQSVVLPCQYQTSSTQTPVVQWWYKSYCRDRTRDAFTLPEKLGLQASALGPSAHLECSDSGRTVRIVASAQGASMTLAEHYRGRDIAIVNRADLRIGELQWGDSGVYLCKVIIANDVEGKDEGQMELLVLGRTGEQDDLLPEFDVEVMPEWAFVGSVVLGSFLVLLFLGICWCQCCPHSCCCYLRCCCCPDTCCCPRHLYEAGKKVKGQQQQHQPPAPVYPYYIPGVPGVSGVPGVPGGPAVLPLVPSSTMDPKITSIPSVDNSHLGGVHGGYRLKAGPHQAGPHQAGPHQDSGLKVLFYTEKESPQWPSAKMAALKPGSVSELSSLHDGGPGDFRHTYQTVQMRALPPVLDLDQRSTMRPAPPTKTHRLRRDRGHLSDDELDRRWNTRSERVQKQTLSRRGRTGSLDELEEFARSYGSRGRRPEPPDRTYDRDYSPPGRFYRDEEDDWGGRSPSPTPPKRRDTWDSDRPCPPPRSRAYDDTFLAGVLESKARGRGGGERGGGRADEDSDTPSKGSSRGKGSDSFYSRSPSNRPEEDDPLPPYCEADGYRRADPGVDRYRTAEPPKSDRYRGTEHSARPFCYTRPPQHHQGAPHTLQGGRDERNRNLVSYL